MSERQGVQYVFQGKNTLITAAVEHLSITWLQTVLMQLIEGRKIYLLNLLTVAIPWLERQIVWKLKSSNTFRIA